MRTPRYIPLRLRFILLSSCLLILLFGVIALLLGYQQSRSIRSEVEKRGTATAQSLAATSKAALATYNYVALEQSANQAADGPDIVYVIIHDKEGRIGGFSGRADLQGKFLKDPLSVRALSSVAPLVQTEGAVFEGTPVVDIAVPVFLPGSEHRWGTVRVALSLEPMYRQIRQTEWIIAATGCMALVLGILLSSWAARRITLPLGHLMNATVEAAQGNLTQNIKVHTGDEVEVLASNFSTMMGEILSQKQQLEMQLSEIRRLQRYTEELLITMNDGLLSVDRAGNLAAINPAACRMLGIPQGITKGRSMRELVEKWTGLMEYLEEMVQEFHGRTQREIHIESGGEMQVILANSSVLNDADGAPLEVITNLQDITELKRLEARIRQTERLAAMGTLAAGMAHEIRNPLSAIKTFVQLLPRKLEKPGFLDKFNRTVPRELERINRLIEDLLELSRDPKYHFEVVDIEALATQVVELFEEEFIANGIRFNWEFTHELPTVWADPDQLVKAFVNLIRNAIQAMPQGGDFAIGGYSEKDYSKKTGVVTGPMDWACITFKDTGSGVSQETMKSIFNPFFTTKDSGTGLGLAITHKVITEHGGHIDVRSQLGEGCCFSICLPALNDPKRKEFQ